MTFTESLSSSYLTGQSWTHCNLNYCQRNKLTTMTENENCSKEAGISRQIMKDMEIIFGHRVL
jgi:hypothetical protein